MAVVTGLAVLLIACGKSDTQQTDPAETSASASAASDTSAKVIEVVMKDYAYEPSNITLPAGRKIVLKLTNTGTVEHYFAVGKKITGNGEGFEKNLFAGVSVTKTKGGKPVEAEEHDEGDEHHGTVFELHAGNSGTMTFTLPPSKAGTYTIACIATQGGKKHYQMGMKGTLTVTPSAEK